MATIKLPFWTTVYSYVYSFSNSFPFKTIPSFFLSTLSILIVNVYRQLFSMKVFVTLNTELGILFINTCRITVSERRVYCYSLL